MNDDEPKANGPEDLGWTPVAVTRPPKKLPIPPSAPRKACSSCRAPIVWIETASRRRMPVDLDGTSHFATCPNAAAHRGKR